MIEASMRIPPDYALFIPRPFRKAVRLPVIGVGRIKDPIQAERILSEGHADWSASCATRSPIPNSRARRGKTEPTISASACPATRNAWDGWDSTAGWACIETPATGQEKRYGGGTLSTVTEPKRVLVIGGGPAIESRDRRRPSRASRHLAGKGSRLVAR